MRKRNSDPQIEAQYEDAGRDPLDFDEERPQGSSLGTLPEWATSPDGCPW